MLRAYYDKSCDSSSLFQKLNISNDSSYTQHLNKHNVVFLDIQNFLHETQDIWDYIRHSVHNILFSMIIYILLAIFSTIFLWSNYGRP